MKCEFCGGEVGRNQRYCSYCGGENQTAVLHEQKVEEKKKKNQNLKEAVVEKHGSAMVNKVMSFVLAGAVVLFIISLVATFIMDNQELGKMNTTKAEQFYVAGEYGKLQSYVYNSAYDYSNNKYTQLSNIYQTYMRFLYDRDSYIEAMEQGKGDLETTLSILARNMLELLNPLDSWGYQKALGNNQEIFDACSQDVKDFLVAYFDFTEEELADLIATEDKSTYDMQDEFVERIKNIYYRQKGNTKDE